MEAMPFLCILPLTLLNHKQQTQATEHRLLLWHNLHKLSDDLFNGSLGYLLQLESGICQERIFDVFWYLILCLIVLLKKREGWVCQKCIICNGCLIQHDRLAECDGHQYWLTKKFKIKRYSSNCVLEEESKVNSV
jgi:hypothetical protein